jgi:ABC-type transport system involved in multi-copper enzyme maturation permease subunit
MLIWAAVWLALGLTYSTLFNSLSSGAKDFQTAIQSLPKSITTSFNIGEDYLSKVENFLSGQFLTLFTLAGTVFGVMIGVGEIGGKIEDGTLVHFMTKNLSRIQIYLLQNLTNIVFLGVSNVIIWAGIYLEFKLFATSQSDIHSQFFALGCLATWLMFVAASSFGQFLGAWFSKNIAQYSGITILVFMWFLHGLSNTDGYPDWLKPLTIFYYLDVPKLRDEFLLDTSRTLVFVLITIISVIFGSAIFRQKDLRL